MYILPGCSNKPLALKVAKLSRGTLGQVECTEFANGETRISVREKKLSGEAVILQSLSIPVNEHIVEFCLLADAVTRMGVTNLVGVVPWLGYSKQDKVFLPGEPLSSKVVAQILQTTKMKKLITFDLHNRAILGFFDIPVTELSAKPLFTEYFRTLQNKHTIVVAPDAGSVKASTTLAHTLNVPIVYMDKQRDLVTGKVAVVGMSGSVKGREVLITDDMIVTGSTMMEAAKALKKAGATRITVSATHHLYVPGAQEKLEASAIDEIVVTDTVAQSATSQKSKVIKSVKLKILSVAGLIAAELQG